MKLLKKDLGLFLIILIPFIYLVYLWNDLPETVPTHWNIKGEIDAWSSKKTLILIPFALPVLTYLILSLIPIIDPKGKVEASSKKFQSIKFILTLFMSVLALFILHSVQAENLGNPNIILILLGLLYLILGNFMKTFKANYFIGIRTPWTLESEAVWKSTHSLAGKLWFIGGLVIIIFSLFLEPPVNLWIFMSITGIITVVPVVYSYLEFRKNKN